MPRFFHNESFEKEPVYEKQATILLNYLVDANHYTFIKKEPFEKFLLNVVHDNRKKICSFLNEEFNEWVNIASTPN